jgi:hypothetical protein
MIKASAFRISGKPYAVDMESYRLVDGHGRGELNAVWFRRRTGKTVACAGWLWDYQEPCARTAAEFLKLLTDGRHGGNCAARWDGTTLWSLADEAQRAEYLRVLVPMLEDYPAVPSGWSGWWVFPR